MSDWIKKKRLNWPEGSKERVLIRDYPGCKTAVEALEVKRLKNRIEEANTTGGISGEAGARGPSGPSKPDDVQALGDKEKECVKVEDSSPPSHGFNPSEW